MTAQKSTFEVSEELADKLRAAGSILHVLGCDTGLEEVVSATVNHVAELVDQARELLEDLDTSERANGQDAAS